MGHLSKVHSVPPGHPGVEDHTPCLLPSLRCKLTLTSKHPESREQDLDPSAFPWCSHTESRERAFSGRGKVGGRHLETQGEVSRPYSASCCPAVFCLQPSSKWPVGAQSHLGSGPGLGPCGLQPRLLAGAHTKGRKPSGGGREAEGAALRVGGQGADNTATPKGTGYWPASASPDPSPPHLLGLLSQPRTSAIRDLLATSPPLPPAAPASLHLSAALAPGVRSSCRPVLHPTLPSTPPLRSVCPQGPPWHPAMKASSLRSATP